MAAGPKASAKFSNLSKHLAGGKRKAGKSKWLCCFRQSVEAEADLSKAFEGKNTLRDANKTSLPSTVYPNKFADLEVEGDTFECECCYSESLFEKLVQCADGHLFCFTCLKKQVEESTFGVLPANRPLACMYMGGCKRFIPWSEIQRGIKKGLLSKFEQQQVADDIAQAQIPGMSYCPACNLACVLDPDVVVFKCPSDQCGKATCIKCKKPFHEGTCNNEEEKPQANKCVEEAMSESLIRECVRCKAGIIKNSGCNKVKCRCGAVMCYTCRQSIKDYSHFCRKDHGSRGSKCKICGQCKLFYKEDTTATVNAAMEAALREKGKTDPETK